MTQETFDPRDAAILAEVASHVVTLMESHWRKIKAISSDEANAGIVRLSLAVTLNFNGPAPSGSVNMSYAVRVKDGATFALPDPNQLELIQSEAGNA